MKKYLNPKYSIRSRLIFLYVAQVIFIISVASIILQWRIRNVLEEELSNHLETVASLVSLQMDGEILSHILPGDERTRSNFNIINMLRSIKKRLV